MGSLLLVLPRASELNSTLDMDRDFNILTSKHMKHHITSDVEFSSEALGKTNNKEIENHKDVVPDKSLITADNVTLHTDSQVDNTLDDTLGMIHTDSQVANTLDDTLGMIHTDNQDANTLDMAHYTAATL